MSEHKKIGADHGGCVVVELETVQQVRSMTIEDGVSGQPQKGADNRHRYLLAPSGRAI